MRLLIIGTLNGYMSEAGKIALAKGVKVSHVDTTTEALESLRDGNGADLIFLDIAQDVSHLAKNLTSERISIPIITCGINTGSTQAAASIKNGATDYVPLPPDPELIAAIFAAVTRDEKELVYADPAMEHVLKLSQRIAPSDATILVTGQSGTGKEVIAHYIHKHSKRANEKFISINCAAIPENLLESELFGHEKGSFTGAVARRIGKFEEASGGTLLLDEISEMHPRLQAKLLRAIQEREIDRVGGTNPIKINIRLIATSNRNLEEEVRNNTFREDLYFRLNVVNITLPPLKERPLDITHLAKHFIKKYSEINQLPQPEVKKSALHKLQQYQWPGNIRELENAMHRAVLFCTDGLISEQNIMLPEDINSTNSISIAQDASMVGRTISDVEKELIIDTLDHCLGNRTQAAHILGISIRTLRNKLKMYTESDNCSMPKYNIDKTMTYKTRV